MSHIPGIERRGLLQSTKSIWESRKIDELDRRHKRPYVVFASEAFKHEAIRLESMLPDRFKYFPILWNKFPDGTDNIKIEGFQPYNQIANENILFFASFHNNDVTLSQFSVLIVLLQSFIESLTIILPYFPVGTNERVDFEGTVATANTYSMLFSNLPSIGRPIRIMIYDIHTLQNRFYFHSSTVPSLHSSIPLLLHRLKSSNISAICFPDDGAAKRFSGYFKKIGYEIIVCGKVRDGDKRIVRIQDGNPEGKNIVIVDDLVQTGGTLYECGLALKAANACEVSCFVSHAVFPNESWKLFSKSLNGPRAIFTKIFLTNSIPLTTYQLNDFNDVFEVFDLLPLILQDLDYYIN